MNWGGFAGGFAQGFNNGVNIGKTVGDAFKQKKLDDLRAKGIEEAKGLQQSAIADLIKDNGLDDQPQPTTTPADARVEANGVQASPVAAQPKIEATPLGPAGQPTPQASAASTPAASAAATPAQAMPATTSQAEPQRAPTMPEVAAQAGVKPAPRGRFSVGDRQFNTREEAEAFARTRVPSVMDFMAKTLVPKMQETYLAQGDVEKAEAWTQWAEQRQSKRAMSEWASAWRAASMGNIEKAADHVFNLYKTYDDGITPLSKEVVKDKDGNITGFNVKLKVDETGEERTQFIDQKALTEMGLAALSPPQMFEQQFKRQQEADQAAAAQRAELAKEGRAEAREIAKEGRAEARDNRKASRDQGYALEKLSITEQLRQSGASQKVQEEVNAKVGVLRRAGYSDQFINEALPSILGLGEYKKGASPEEARRMIYQERIKDTYGFARKSPEEQKAMIERDMEIIYGKPSTATPAAGGLPQQPSATPQRGRGVPVYDPATGQIVYR
jgi:hypothetical protein